MTTGEDALGCDYFTPVFLLPQLCNSTPQIYKEKISGSTRRRPQLEEVLRYLRKGNQLIVTSMDRLARSLVDLHTIVEDLVGRRVSVRFLCEGQTYSAKADPIANLMLGLMGSVAEFERSLLRSVRLRE